VTAARRPGRPRRSEADAIDERVRASALRCFLASGFDGTTMEAVAATAGVSKRTLYAKFPNKRALFAAVVPDALARMPFSGDDLDPGSDPRSDPDGDLEAALRSLGRRIVSRLVDPEAVSLRRLAVLESHRFPEFGAAANSDLWRHHASAVVDLLERHARTGAIVVDDVELVADAFVAIVAGEPTILSDLGVRRSVAEEARRIDHAVRLLLAGLLAR
jgi:TetR/AcrR family transcriptional repressor of mexJK operon